MQQCPNCGRPIAFEEKYAKVLSCPYCNSILEFGSWELEKIGEQGYFIEFPSKFIVWKQIQFAWEDISIKGQLRFEYDWWFFDEFFVEILGKPYYIKEDDGNISILEELSIENYDISLIDKIVWQTFDYKWKNLYIEEVWVFKLVNLKWYVQTNISIWKEYEYLVWIFKWRRYFFEKEIWKNELVTNIEIKSFSK